MNIYGICFIQLDTEAPRLFGFPEFLAGLALMALVWSTVDVRYRFRISCAPLPLEKLTFWVVSTVGILTAFTDLWRAEGWFVPCGKLLTPNSWQTLLAMTLLIAFLSWAWFAFIRPPIFGRINARRYMQALYKSVIKGNPAELSVVADELSRSAKSLVSHATDLSNTKKTNTRKHIKYNTYADEILLLIADNRLCKSIVDNAPHTALLLFLEITEQSKQGVDIKIFAKNIVGQALLNKNSFIYHELTGYDTGLMGYEKPVTVTIFSDPKTVEQQGSLFDQNFQTMRKWDSEQWDAYCRMLLISFESSIEFNIWHSPSYLLRALDKIAMSLSGLYSLNGISNSWESNESKQLTVVMDFLMKCMEITNKHPIPKGIYIKLPKDNPHQYKTIHDHLAETLLKVIYSVSHIRSPRWECWNYQHNMVWSKIFSSESSESKSSKIIKSKLRRLIYNEISKLEKTPNYKGATILAFLLNVTSLNSREKGRLNRANWPLKKVVRAWIKKNYMTLHNSDPKLTTGLLAEGVNLDLEHKRLIKKFPESGLRKKIHYTYIQLN